jgi:methionyl-tRNA synthetase
MLDEEGLALVKKCRDASETIAKHYEERRFNLAIVEICRLADAVNEYFDRLEPWKTVKSDLERTRTTLTAALNAFRVIAIYLKPILPCYADKAMELFGESDWKWESIFETVENTVLNGYKYLASRIEAKQVEDMISSAIVNPGSTGEVAHESRASKNKQQKKSVEETSSMYPPIKDQIEFQDFEKLDLRVGLVKSCEIVPKSSKLLKLVLDCGNLGERTIFSGIRQAYPESEKLVGKQVVFVANLAPRKMSVGISEGMVLFAGDPGKAGGVVTVDAAEIPGAQAT